MRKKGFKGRCEKRVLGKSKEVCRLYDPIQSACADWLQNNDGVQEIRCNVPQEGSEYTTDFLCTKSDGDLMVRECVQRKHRVKKLLIAPLINASNHLHLDP